MIKIEDNDSPITVAQKIIHGTKTMSANPYLSLGRMIATGKSTKPGETFEVDMFDDSEIREIAAYLLTYCKYNSEEQE